MELAEGSSMLYFGPVAQIAVLNVDANVTGHLWPPIIAGYQFTSSSTMVGKAPDWHALIWDVVDFHIFASRLSSTLQVEHCSGHFDILTFFVCQLISGL
jgi:hypothetical protein